MSPQSSDLSEWCAMYWRHNTKVSYTWQNTAEAAHSSATGPMRLAWLVPVLCSLPHHCTTRNPRKGYERHSQFKPTNLWNPPVHCSVSVPHVGLSRAFTRLLQLWDSGRHSHSSNELREKHLHHQLIHFTTDSCSPKLPSVLRWNQLLCSCHGQRHPAGFPELHQGILLPTTTEPSSLIGRGLVVSHEHNIIVMLWM